LTGRARRPHLPLSRWDGIPFPGPAARRSGGAAHFYPCSDQGRPIAPRRIVRPFTQLKEVRLAGDFEGVVTYGIGLAARGDFRVFTLTGPDRLVVDLAFPKRHRFDCRSAAVKVFFATPDGTAAAATRRVPTPAVGRGALTAMFAGPTDFDRPAGGLCCVVRSRAVPRSAGGCADQTAGLSSSNAVASRKAGVASTANS